MFRRTMEAAFLNTVANHPDVRPFLGGGDAELDLGPMAANPANIVLEAPEKGGWLLQPILPGVYELHTLFLPEARGRAYFAMARGALNYVFTATDALEIVTKCPDDNGGARMAASLMGFRERFRREGAWESGCGISYQALSIDDWVARDRTLIPEGRAFHEAIEAATQGASEPHPQDDAHDRVVGAAVQMIKAGQTGKAIGVFNRWAVFAGYATIAEVAANVVDIQTAVIAIHHGEMRVLLVRRPPK